MTLTRPPGALLLAIALGAGLLTGLSHFLEPLVVIPLLVAAAWALRAQWWWPALPAVAAGMLVGRQAQAGMTHSCAATLRSGAVELRLHLVDPGAGSGRVTVVSPACPGEIIARWPRNADWAAGTVVDVRGRWSPRAGALGRRDGMLLVLHADAAPGVMRHLTLLDRFRTFLARASARLYGARAPLVDALVTGRRGDLDPDLRAAFTASGLVHLLAISGFHIGLLAAWVLLALRLAGVSRHRAALGATLAAMGYAALLGWPAPAARSAILVAIHAWNRWRQRQPTIAALFGASMLPLFLCFPWSITDIGAWLSVVALAGVTAATRWSDRAVNEAGWVRALSASIGASCATAPVTALVFGQVAPIAVLLGIVAGPLAALVQPAIMVSLLLAQGAPFLAGALAASGGVLLALFETIVRWGATAPGAAAPGVAGVGAAWPWLMVLGAALWIIRGRSTLRRAGQRLAWAVTAALWLALVVPRDRGAGLAPGELGLFFLDVGQGDAALIRTPGGHWIAVDAGPASDRWDAGKRVVLPFLAKMGAHRIELFVASHAHRDHIGGAAALLRGLPVGVVLDPGEPFLDQGYLDWLGVIAEQRVRWRQGEPGMQWKIDGVTFRVVHPPPAWPHRGEDLNEDSIVLEVRYGGFTTLLTGDAGLAAEERYLGDVGQVDLLKVGHHGSRGATGDALLARTRPRLAVISVGENNYGHPSPEAMARLMHAGVRVLRTDQEGLIAVRTDGRTVSVRGAVFSATFTTNGAGPGR